jgi:hypothetical protein
MSPHNSTMDFSWISIAYALAAALATALMWLGINPLVRWKLRHLPGPFAWPFIGNLPSIVRYGIHEYTVRVARKYGPVALIWFGGDPTVVVSDPELARKVLLRFNQRRIFPGVLRGEDYEVDRRGLVWAKALHWRIARWGGGGAVCVCVGGCTLRWWAGLRVQPAAGGEVNRDMALAIALPAIDSASSGHAAAGSLCLWDPTTYSACTHTSTTVCYG